MTQISTVLILGARGRVWSLAKPADLPPSDLGGDPGAGMKQRPEEGTSWILNAEPPDAVDRAGILALPGLTPLQPARQLIRVVRRYARSYQRHRKIFLSRPATRGVRRFLLYWSPMRLSTST